MGLPALWSLLSPIRMKTRDLTVVSGWWVRKTSIKQLEMPGIEPGASRMLSARSTTELHPLIFWFHKILGRY